MVTTTPLVNFVTEKGLTMVKWSRVGSAQTQHIFSCTLLAFSQILSTLNNDFDFLLILSCTATLVHGEDTSDCKDNIGRDGCDWFTERGVKCEDQLLGVTDAIVYLKDWCNKMCGVC